jgi:hypothetical protein
MRWKKGTDRLEKGTDSPYLDEQSALCDAGADSPERLEKQGFMLCRMQVEGLVTVKVVQVQVLSPAS